MSQRENKRWWRIRTKIFVGLFLAFIFGCLALTYSVNKQTNTSNETQIKKDVSILLESTQVYVRQTLLLNEGYNNEESFRVLATSIISDLYGAGMRHVALYTLNGNMLISSRNTLFTTDYMADLVMAIKGESSYTIVRDKNDAMYV